MALICPKATCLKIPHVVGDFSEETTLRNFVISIWRSSWKRENLSTMSNIYFYVEAYFWGILPITEMVKLLPHFKSIKHIVKCTHIHKERKIPNNFKPIGIPKHTLRDTHSHTHSTVSKHAMYIITSTHADPWPASYPIAPDHSCE